jgi:hypothetical protein
LHDFIGGSCEPLAWSAKARLRFNQTAATRLLHTLNIGPAKFSASAHSAIRMCAKESAIASSDETISDTAESWQEVVEQIHG